MPIEPTRCFVQLPHRIHGLANALGGVSVGTRPLPEPLVTTTVKAALRISRDKVPPAQALSRHTAWLVREATEALAKNQWQLALLLSLCLAGWRQ